MKFVSLMESNTAFRMLGHLSLIDQAPFFPPTRSFDNHSYIELPSDIVKIFLPSRVLHLVRVSLLFRGIQPSFLHNLKLWYELIRNLLGCSVLYAISRWDLRIIKTERPPFGSRRSQCHRASIGRYVMLILRVQRIVCKMPQQLD